MTYKENKIDMADVCELAHVLTVKECERQKINVDCLGLMDCTDGGQDHEDTNSTHYGAKAQIIFDHYYDLITNTLKI